MRQSESCLLLASQTNGEIAGRFPVNKELALEMAALMAQVRFCSGIRRVRGTALDSQAECTTQGEPEDSAGSEAPREGGLADSLPSRAPHCRHILRARSPGA